MSDHIFSSPNGIFRCYYCNEIKPIEAQVLFNDINLCSKCHPIYKKLVAPKVCRPVKWDTKDEIDNEIEEYERAKSPKKKKK